MLTFGFWEVIFYSDCVVYYVEWQKKERRYGYFNFKKFLIVVLDY